MSHLRTPDLTRTHACEQVIGYEFKGPLLLWEALQADGSPIALGCNPRFRSGNKRLAVVGDRVLDLLLSLKWYPTWEERLEFDKLRNKVVSNKALVEVGQGNRLERFITPAAGASRVEWRAMSATVEAIVGAAYLDGGLDAAKVVVKGLGIDAPGLVD
ncbi:MAG: hypothetical protein Q9219_005688 [cf. Caloplaca sp. 3 TL-2023]